MTSLKLSDLLTLKRTHCRADDKSIRKIFELIASKFSDSSGNEQASEIFKCFAKREALGSTGLGNGIAIPHCRSKHTDCIKGALITLKNGLNFQAHDNQHVDIIFAIIAPEEVTEAHSDILQAVQDAFSDEEFCEKLRD
ncbi:MAG: PTS sugar transporter subunit IIA, partial [Pseudomonadota bacterium]